jgi:GAF domain-containing protein
VLTTRQPLVVDDLSSDTRWSRTQAESTGYVPKSMMAVPLLVEERALGVLNVLDRRADEKLKLAEVDLLGLFANQAAIALVGAAHAGVSGKWDKNDGLVRFTPIAYNM